MSNPAVILLSGGLDSATTLAAAINQGYVPHAITFDYGQRHRFELAAAERVAKSFNVTNHVIFKIDLDRFGGSALTAEIPVPKDRPINQMASDIPPTYVPARNTVFLSLALAWAETLGAADIFIGVNALDYSGYPDCREDFIRAFESMASLATRASAQGQRLKIHTPLIELRKDEIIRYGLGMGVDYSLTHSCYDPHANGQPCGRCDACQLRLEGFRATGVADPLEY